MKRRDALLSAVFGPVGLRALATGLPAWFIGNPRRANAQTLACAISAKEKMQFLVVSTSSNGDPLNCNCPGTYEIPDIVHPDPAKQPAVAPTTVMLGSKTYGAALPWASNATPGGALAPATLSRMAFFHHMTHSTVHGDQPKVMKLLGAVAGGDMMISAYAKRLGPCLGTIQNEPVALGSGFNASELVSYGGRSLAPVSPTQLKQLLTGSKNDPLVKLRTLRDKALDQLNAAAKQDATKAQSQFLDAFAASQTQVRNLSDQLATTLNMIKNDSVDGQALAAAALFAANVTPVATVHINFGGDNHTDADLAAEANQLASAGQNGQTAPTSGVKGIQAVLDAMASLNLADKVTFATFNVFGRNLAGVAKVASRGGRDHYGNHAVMVMVGKNVAPGVIGGPAAASGGAYIAADIDSVSGAAKTGGDIPAADTHIAACRTLGVALGIPAEVVDQDLVQGSGGKVVKAALTV